MADAGLYEPNPALLAAVLVGCLAWLAIAALITVVRWPRVGEPGPETSQLTDESPAVVNLLTSHFKMTDEALPATVVDLAAKRAVSLERIAPNRYLCRLRSKTIHELPDYEERVLRHLRSLAVNGEIPTEAMTTGPEEQSRTWRRKFEGEVIADAQDWGLATPLWSNWAAGRFALGAFALFVLFEVAIGFRDLDEVASTALLNACLVLAVPIGFALAAMFGTTRQRPTEKGKSVARRWLGVGEHLANNPSFRDIGPDSVAMWERYLAYATAMGLAGGTAEALPLGAEDPRRAWSSYGGRWRVVEVRYPRLRIGWGRHPLLALLHAALFIAIGAFVLRLVGEIGGRETSWSGGAELGAGLALIGATFASAVILAVGLLEGGRAIFDLFSAGDVEGIVLRHRKGPKDRMDNQRWYAAIDDGTSPQIRAYLLPHRLSGAVTRRDVVKARVTPMLGYVRSIEVVGRSGPGA